METFGPCPTTDIVIKTCRKDFPWLAYCLRFHAKYATGFRQTVLLVDNDDDYLTVLDMTSGMSRSIHVVPPVPTDKPYVIDRRFPNSAGVGYVWQMASKLSWMDFTDADCVLFADSDHTLRGPMSAESLWRDGHPRWVRVPRAEAGGGRVWLPTVDYFIGAEVPHIYLCDPAMYYTRPATVGFLAFMRERFGQTPWEYVLDSTHPQMTEHGCFGAYLGMINAHGYEFVSPKEHMSPVDQKWSWGGLTPAMVAELEERLAR
jgi:hypothetical protein